MSRLEFGVPVSHVDVNLADPLRFESQAAYLERLGLVLPGKDKRLKPRDFEPEMIPIDAEGEAA